MLRHPLLPSCCSASEKQHHHAIKPSAAIEYSLKKEQKPNNPAKYSGGAVRAARTIQKERQTGWTKQVIGHNQWRVKDCSGSPQAAGRGLQAESLTRRGTP